MKNNYTWTFTCRDNGGKFQVFKIKASDKTSAINKGFAKAKKEVYSFPLTNGRARSSLSIAL